MLADPATAERVIELVEAALGRDPDARGAFLADACAGDGALRLEVESLLGFQGQARGFLETPAFSLDVAALPAGETGGEMQAGETLGDCKILSLLGEGGMGEVYLADDTALGRRVAVKLLRRGVGGETIMRRFQHERRVLAGLNHPHIARLYGGAVTPDGRPYLVMEYVEGERLDHYCDRHQLPVGARLTLFRKVCSAVAYAHQNLVIHRDLKPGNILVTADGEPKLLDFGIAKLLDPDATGGQPEATMTFAAAMTPGYASPEQLRGDPISTASDTYSLGVVLYELLTGQRPHAVTGRRPEDFVRAFDRPTTERPSAAVARTATTDGKLPACGESSERLRRRLRGDLDNIVLMAMRREPARRYVSVSQLSADIGRHCDGQPVVARKDTLGYRAGKFVRRNRVGVAAAVLLFLSLVAGIVATTRQAARANRRFNDVRRLAHAILFEVDPLINNLPGSMPARTALVHHALEYLDSLSQEAGTDRELQRELATAYEKVGDVQGNPSAPNVGDIKGALASYGKARDLRQALILAAPRDGRLRDELANNYEQVGYILWWMDQTEHAQGAYDAALVLRKALIAEQPRSVDYRKGLAGLEVRIGEIPAWNMEPAKAMAAYNVALPLYRELAVEQPGNVNAQYNVACCLRRMGDTQKDADDFDGALARLAEAHDIIEPIVRRDANNANACSELWQIAFKRCELFLQQNNAEKAMAVAPEMVSLAEDIRRRDPSDIGAQHKLANSHSYFGQAYLLDARYTDAIGELTKALELDSDLCAKASQSGSYMQACAIHHLDIGKAQRYLGQWNAALENLRVAANIEEKSIADRHDDQQTKIQLADIYRQIGEVLAAQDCPVPAREALGKAVAFWQMLAASGPLDKANAATFAEIQARIASIH